MIGQYWHAAAWYHLQFYFKTEMKYNALLKNNTLKQITGHSTT